jgi:hypothetical protein
VAVVAPYFALKGLGPEGTEGIAQTVRFANNFIAQGYKLGASKPVLNRTACRLLRLHREALDECPFLTREDDVWLVDLSAVPEKYRLDPGRCEELLERLLGAWLEAVDGAAAVN